MATSPKLFLEYSSLKKTYHLFQMSMQTKPDPEVAKEIANQIVLHILPRYPVMREVSVHDAMEKVTSPIGPLLWYIGDLLRYYSEFQHCPRIRPNYEGATAAVMAARETQPPKLVLAADLLYAIFGLYSRNVKFQIYGMESASARLVQIPEEDKDDHYYSLTETFARLQLDNFKLPSRKLKEYELIRATLRGCLGSTTTPYTTNLTLRGIEFVQEVTNFWATPNNCANTQTLGNLRAKILQSTSGAQAKHLTAMLYMPVFCSGEPTELVKDAMESAVDFLDYLQNQSILDRIRRLSLECTLLKSIMTMWDGGEASRELLQNYPLDTYLVAATQFLDMMTISFYSKEDPAVWELKNSELLGFNYKGLRDETGYIEGEAGTWNVLSNSIT